MLTTINKLRFGMLLILLIVLSSQQSSWEGSPGFVKAAVQNCNNIQLTPRNLPPGTVGTPYVQKLTVIGTGANERPLVFQLISGALPDGLGLNTESGEVSGTPTKAGTFSFSASVTNAVGCSSTQSYTIKVNAATCQTITLSSPLPNGIVGTGYNQTVTVIGGTGPYGFSLSGLLPDGLSLSASGLVSGTPTKTGSFNFTITATDSLGCQGSQDYSIATNCPGINLSSSLPNGTVGTDYKQTITASGGNGPYNFNLSGTFPDGLSLSSDGQLSGTPTKTGSFNFTITATDKFGCQGSQSYSIAANCPGINLSSSLPNGKVGTSYNETVTASGGNGPYSFTLSDVLPDGLSLSSEGLLTGTPTKTGSFNFTITATDKFGCQASQNYSIATDCPGIKLSSSLPAGTVGTNYKQTITASGGNGPYSFSLSDVLPDGLSLSSDGQLSGTPTKTGSSTFTITGKDKFGCAGTQSYTIATSCPGMTLSPTALPGGKEGIAYKGTVTASGGNGPYSFNLSGDLPDGLSLSSDGLLTGTPKSSGDFSFTITATDKFGCKVSQSYKLKFVINSLLQFSTPSYKVNKGEASANVTITRQSGSDGSVTVGFATSNGSAVAGLDYTVVNRTVTFNDKDSSSKTITIPLLNNGLASGDRTVNLFLINPTGGAKLGNPNAAILTIIDNSRPVPDLLQFNSASYSVNENDGTATITVNRTGNGNSLATVEYATAGGNAVEGSNYVPTSGTLAFDPNVMTRSFNIRIVNNNLAEGDKTIILTLSSPNGNALLGQINRSILTIIDDDKVANPPFLEADQNIDFGPINLGQSVKRVVNLRNRGGGQLTFSAPTLTDGAESGFSIDSQPPVLSLGPGESTILSVQFKPVSIADNLTGKILVSSNGGSATINLRGQGADIIKAPEITRPTGDEIITAGLPYVIRFSTAKESQPASFTIAYSTDGGETFASQNEIGRLGPDARSIIWNVPDGVEAAEARIRVIVRSQLGNVATAISNPIKLRRAAPPPISLASGDFNADGKVDLATVSAGSDSVFILLGDGNGEFPMIKEFPAGKSPRSIVVGDFNKDGKLDLATANFGSSNISVLLGNGNGTFSPEIDIAAGAAPLSIVTGDINGDGRLDLATANSTGNVSILLGDGTGRFAPARMFQAGDGCRSITAGDFNRDGKLDLATANFSSDTLSVLFGDGAGGFARAISFPTGSNPISIVTGDFNADGNLDLVTANFNSDNISILFGDGIGSFGKGRSFSTGSGPVSITAADFTGQGRLNLAVTNFNNDSVSILLQDGTGVFGAPRNFTTGPGPVSISAAIDLNGDGKSDLVTGNQITSNISILPGTELESFGQPFNLELGATTPPKEPLLKVVVTFDPPPPGRIEPPQNLRVNASPFTGSNLSESNESSGQIENAEGPPELAGYNIYRVPEPNEDQPLPTADEIVGNPDNLVGSVPSNVTTFTDIVSTSKGNNFVYSAASFFNNGSRSGGAQPAATQLPVIKNPDFRKGSIFIDVSGSFIQTGAVLIINETEAFPLRLDDSRVFFTVPKKAESSPGGMMLKKLLKKGVSVQLTVKNPDGKLSVAVPFKRTE